MKEDGDVDLRPLFFLLPFVTCLVILGVRMFLLRVSLNMLLRIVREGGLSIFCLTVFLL